MIASAEVDTPAQMFTNAAMMGKDQTPKCDYLGMGKTYLLSHNSAALHGSMAANDYEIL